MFENGERPVKALRPKSSLTLGVFDVPLQAICTVSYRKLFHAKADAQVIAMDRRYRPLSDARREQKTPPERGLIYEYC